MKKIEKVTIEQVAEHLKSMDWYDYDGYEKSYMYYVVFVRGEGFTRKLEVDSDIFDGRYRAENYNELDRECVERYADRDDLSDDEKEARAWNDFEQNFDETETLDNADFRFVCQTVMEDVNEQIDEWNVEEE